MTDTPEKWVERAYYDVGTAEAMLKEGRFLYVLFCCQQAIEKMIKGVIAKRTNNFPPRLHNLMKLAEFAAIEVDVSMAEFFRELSSYYILSRYPDEMDSDDTAVNPDMAKTTFEKTDEIIKWLFSML